MFVQILFMDQGVPTLTFGNLFYLGFMIYYVIEIGRLKDITEVKKRLDSVLFRPAILSFIGGFIDIMLYANSVGGINGGTAYTFMLAINTVIALIVSTIVFTILEIVIRKKHKNENSKRS